MKKALFIGVTIAVFAVLSCNNGLGVSNGAMQEKGNGHLDRSQRTVIDSSTYIDFTLKGTNPASIKKQDILIDLNGTYKIAGGNSYITISRKEGTITLSSDDALWDGKEGQNIYAVYSFDVQAAGDSCLYIKMDSKKTGNFIVSDTSFTDRQIPDLAVCVPLYGYSRNRIEVSPVMRGYSVMPSGTYWAEKK